MKPRPAQWNEGDRIQLLDPDWGSAHGLFQGILGTVIKNWPRNRSFDQAQMYSVLWDDGQKDCIDQSMARRLSPLEALAAEAE